MKKRILSMFMAVVMIFSLAVPAYAQDVVVENTEPATEEVAEATEVQTPEIPVEPEMEPELEEVSDPELAVEPEPEPEPDPEPAEEPTGGQDRGNEESDTEPVADDAVVPETDQTLTEPEPPTPAEEKRGEKEPTADEADVEVTAVEMEQEPAQEAFVGEYSYSVTTSSADLNIPDDRLDQYVEKRLEESVNPIQLASVNYALNQLQASGNTVQAALYQELIGPISQVANGSQTSTVFTIEAATLQNYGVQTSWTAQELGFETITDDNVQAAAEAAGQRSGLSLNEALHALLADCPYEMYWFTSGDNCAESNFHFSMSSNTVGISECIYTFYVADEFQLNGSDTEVDPQYANTVSSAINFAQTIVNDASDYDDMGKLDYYCQRICDLTSYNTAAANGGALYGNPWQLIWVFDNDPSTTVVCEGYSKAFAYLCELTGWRDDVRCLLVSGHMGQEAHMWNIVSINGMSYLVDVTNCDEGVGAPKQLFMTGYDDGDVDNGYVFGCNDGADSITYTYDENTLATYNRADLTLVSKNGPMDSTVEVVPADSNSIAAVNIENITNISASFVFQVNTTVELASEYYYGIETSSTQDFSADISRWTMRGNEVCNNATLVATFENFVPGQHSYYRAILQNSSHNTVYTEDAVHELTTQNHQSGIAAAVLDTTYELTEDGNYHYSFTSASGGLYVLEGTGLSGLDIMSATGAQIGGAGNRVNYLLPFIVPAGSTVYFTLHCFGSASYTMAIRDAVGTLEAASTESAIPIHDNTPVTFTATRDGAYRIHLNTPSGALHVLNQETWSWNHCGGSGSMTATLAEGETVYLMAWYDESNSGTYNLVVEEIAPAQDYSIATVDLTTMSYGSTWANFSVEYGAPVPEDGTEYAVGVIFAPANQIPSGFEGGEAWLDGIPYDMRANWNQTMPASEGTVIGNLRCEDMVPDLTYYYEAFLALVNSETGQFIDTNFGGLRQFTTAEESVSNTITLREAVSVPQNATTCYVFTPETSGIYAVDCFGADYVTVRRSDGSWINGDNSDNISSREYKLGFLAEENLPVYIFVGNHESAFIGNHENMTTLVVDDAVNVLPELELGTSPSYSGRQVLQFTASEADRYTFSISSDDRGEVKYADLARLEWISDGSQSVTLDLQQGETVYLGSWFDHDGAMVVYTVERFVPATEDIISASNAFDINDISAQMTVTMSVTDETANAGYNWGIKYSTYNYFQDAQGQDAWDIWGWYPSNEARNNWSTQSDISGLTPGVTYYYKAILFRDEGMGPIPFYEEPVTHQFTTTGTVNSLPVIELGTTSVSVNAHTVYRFTAPAEGVYVLHGENLDYLSVRSIAGYNLRVPTYFEETETTRTHELYFVADANEVLCICTGKFMNQEQAGTIQLNTMETVATPIGTEAVATTGARNLYQFTAPADGWYEIFIDNDEIAHLQMWEDRDWVFYNRSAVKGFAEGQTAFFQVECDEGQSVNIAATRTGSSISEVLVSLGENPDIHYYFNIVDVLTITDTLVVPKNVELRVYNTLTIAEGGALENHGDVLIREGGSVVVAAGGSLNMIDDPENHWSAMIAMEGGALQVNGAATFDENSVVLISCPYSEMQNALNAVSGVDPSHIELEIEVSDQTQFDALWSVGQNYAVNFIMVNDLAVTLTQDLPENYCLVVNPGSSVTVPENTEVQLQGWIAMEGGSLTNNGTLNVNGGINIWQSSSEITNNGQIYVTGQIRTASHDGEPTSAEITNNGYMDISDGNLGEGVTIVGSGGVYTGLTAYATGTESQYVSERVTLNSSITLSVDASANEGVALSYSWTGHKYQNGLWTDVSFEETGNTATIPAVDAAYDVYCYVRDSYGNGQNVTFNITPDTGLKAYVAGTGTSWKELKVPINGSATLAVDVSANEGVTTNIRWYGNKISADGSTEYIEYEETGTALQLTGVDSRIDVTCEVTDNYGGNASVWFYLKPDTGLRAVIPGKGTTYAYYTVRPGESLTLFTDTSVNEGFTLSYQWSVDWTDVEGATGDTYTLEAVDREQTIGCEVSDNLGNSIRLDYYIDVDTGLNAVAAGTNSSYRQIQVSPGDSVVLEVEATAYEGVELNYTWYEYINYEHIDLAESGSSCTLENVQSRREIYCTVRDNYGNSEEVRFVVVIDNGFSVQALTPATTVTEIGEMVTLEIAVSATDRTDLDIWWSRDYGRLEGETGESLTVEAVAGNTWYTVNVTDRYGNTAEVEFSVIAGDGLMAEAVVEDVYARAGDPAVLQVKASSAGGGLSYAWQNAQRTIAGADTDSYVIPEVTMSDEYQCIVTDAAGETKTVRFNVLLDTGFTVEESQDNVIRVPHGSQAVAIVHASAYEGYNLTYNWWTDSPVVSGIADGPTYTIPSVTTRITIGCNVDDGMGNSKQIQFEVMPQDCLPEYGYSNESYVVQPGDSLPITATASIEDPGTFSYVWKQQVRNSGSYESIYQVIESATTNTLTLEDIQHTCNYLCEITDTYGNIFRSWHYVRIDNGFTSDGSSHTVTVPYGGNVTLDAGVSVTNGDLTYTWIAIAGQQDALSTESTLSLTNVTRATTYECRVQDQYNNVYYADFYVRVENGIQLEPLMDGEFKNMEFENPYTGRQVITVYDVPVVPGEDIALSVNLTANDMTGSSLIWYKETLTRSDYGAHFSGDIIAWNGTSLTVPDITADEQYYLVEFLDRYGNTASIRFRLVLAGTEGPNAVRQSGDIRGETGDVAVLSFVANGEGLTYQWQYQNAGSVEWVNAAGAGAASSYMRIALTAEDNGRHYRCVATDSNNLSVTSIPVTVRVGAAAEELRIVSQPEDVTAEAGSKVQFTVVAEGEDLSYQWQYKTKTADWKNTSATGNKTATLKVDVTASEDGDQYRCIVTDGAGNSLTSNIATLTVKGNVTPILAEDVEIWSYILKPGTDESGNPIMVNDEECVNGETFTVDMSETPTWSKLFAKVLPADAVQKVIWSTDPADVATVDTNGVLTFLKPGLVTVSVTTTDGTEKTAWVQFEVKKTPDTLFTDVTDPSAYYYDPVYWAVDNGITVGYGGEGLFSPYADCTREQIVTFLWNMKGKPEPKKIISFTDVAPGKWYEKPISWAAENGITVGLNDGTGRFGVGQACTREMCVSFLHRAVGSPEPGTYKEFTDVSAERYYYKPISWAAENGITVGLNDGTGRFGVGQTCTRGMIVSFLYRFSKLG